MNNMIVLEPKIKQEITTIQSAATSIIITNNDIYVQAGDMLSAIKKVKKNIEEFFRPLKEGAHKSWKQICTRENEEIEKLAPAINHLSKQMTAWNVAQEKVRKAEEERLRQEALQAEEERRLAEALQAEKEGDKELAEIMLGESVFVPLPVVEKSVPKIIGQAMRDYWDFEIINEALIPRQYMQPNLIAIRATVTSLKDKTNILGIKVIKTSKMVGVRT